MNIAITIVHNQGDAANTAQIDALISLVTKITDTNPIFDEQGVQTGTFDTYHYELVDLKTPHELRLYQVVPFGVTPPPNFYQLDSHNVLYRKGDEDKTGAHPRFFNWGVKRSTDYGADVAIYLDNVAAFNPKALAQLLPAKKEDAKLDKQTFGTVVTAEARKKAGELDESKPLSQAVDELKTKVDALPTDANGKGGLKNG